MAYYYLVYLKWNTSGIDPICAISKQNVITLTCSNNSHRNWFTRIVRIYKISSSKTKVFHLCNMYLYLKYCLLFALLLLQYVSKVCQRVALWNEGSYE